MKHKINIMKWKMFFPYRNLCEIFENESNFINTSKKYVNMFDYINDNKILNFKNFVLSSFYNRFKNRFPYIQNITDFYLEFRTNFNTYFPRLIANNIDFINVNFIDDVYNKFKNGDESEMFTKSGTSMSPYNLNFDSVNVDENDNLGEKGLSKTSSNSKNINVLKRIYDVHYSKFSSELNNFINSFYYMFSQINLDEYIENNLNFNITYYKNTINSYIDMYEKLKPYLKKYIKE